jgi:beta-lactamase superfamily II metal-dependent hydrolase
LSSVTLLDVGHGNCAIVQDNGKVAVIDSPRGGLLLNTLEDFGIDTVSVAIISHADADHLGGILSLLTSERIKVNRIYVNPDSQKGSKLWKAFRIAVAVAETKGSCQVLTSLSSTMPGRIDLIDTTIAVVAPSAALALTGVGGTTPQEKPVTANTLSAVLRIDKGNGDGVLLAGDLDQVGLDCAIEAGADMSARVLVFPHHGGVPGTGDARAFTMKLLSAVKPEVLFFSNGRGRHDNPRPEIIEKARELSCTVACSQLSERCNSQTIQAEAYLEPIRAQGMAAGASCAGSITLNLDDGARRLAEADTRHLEFITTEVATPMCLKP